MTMMIMTMMMMNSKPIHSQS